MWFEDRSLKALKTVPAWGVWTRLVGMRNVKKLLSKEAHDLREITIKMYETPLIFLPKEFDTSSELNRLLY